MAEEKARPALKDLIPCGEENAVSVPTLAKILGTNERDVRKQVSNLRTQGELILSSARGYFRPATVGELRRFVSAMTKRGRATFAAVAAARKALRQLEAERGECNAGPRR